jgi:hypothetical protein
LPHSELLDSNFLIWGTTSPFVWAAWAAAVMVFCSALFSLIEIANNAMGTMATTEINVINVDFFIIRSLLL